MEPFSLLLKWLRTTGIAHHSEFCGAKEAAVWHWVAKGKGGTIFTLLSLPGLLGNRVGDLGGDPVAIFLESRLLQIVSKDPFENSHFVRQLA